MASELESLELSIAEAEREVDVAERYLKNSQIKLQILKQQLQTLVISEISGMKSPSSKQTTVAKSKLVEDEAERRARVRRRWRVLLMKIKFGLGAHAMAVKKRNIADASTFIEKETEVIHFISPPQRFKKILFQEASKEDQLDFEGKCHRKKVDKRYFRRGGVAVGSMQNRCNF